MNYLEISEEHYNSLLVSIISIGLGVTAIGLRVFWKEIKKVAKILAEKVDMFIIEIKIFYKSKN